MIAGLDSPCIPLVAVEARFEFFEHVPAVVYPQTPRGAKLCVMFQRTGGLERPLSAAFPGDDFPIVVTCIAKAGVAKPRNRIRIVRHGLRKQLRCCEGDRKSAMQDVRPRVVYSIGLP